MNFDKAPQPDSFDMATEFANDSVSLVSKLTKLIR